MEAALVFADGVLALSKASHLWWVGGGVGYIVTYPAMYAFLDMGRGAVQAGSWPCFLDSVICASGGHRPSKLAALLARNPGTPTGLLPSHPGT